MWCPHCQSDVPQTAGSPIGSRRCCRCGRSADATPRRAGSDEGLDLENGPPAGLTSTASSTWDDWTLAAEVQRARLLLTHAGGVGNSTIGWRIDGQHLLSFDPAEQADIRRDPGSVARPRQSGRSSASAASLAALITGVVTFCSGVVMAASLVDRSVAISRLGVPLMLVGLFCLAIGMLSLVNRMRRESRAALDRMRLLDLRLQEYRRAALLVGSSSHASYGHTPREYMLASARLDDPRFRAFDLVAAKDF